MLLKQKQAKDASLKQGGVEGVFVPKADRLVQQTNMRGAHFKFGHVEIGKTVSTSQDLYAMNRTGAAQAAVTADTAQANAIMKEKQRKSNFNIGQGSNPVFRNETSSAQAYTIDQHTNSQNARADAPNLRKANFNFGSTTLSYDTTTKQNNHSLNEQMKNNGNSLDMDKRKQEQAERVYKNRIQRNFNYGRDANTYQTDNKSSFKVCDLSQTKEAFDQRTANSKFTRKTQFSFGTDGQNEPITKPQNTTSMVSPANAAVTDRMQTAPNYQNKLLDQPKACQTNIQINHNGVGAGSQGQARFASSYRNSNMTHVQPTQLSHIYAERQRVGAVSASNCYSVPNQAKLMTQELRQSNFTLGDHKPDFQTHTNAAHEAYTVQNGNNAANRAQLKTKMQSAQFSLGQNKRNMHTAQTTYGSDVDARARNGMVNGNDGAAIDAQTAMLKKSHFHLGSDKPKQTTEASQAFKGPEQNNNFNNSCIANDALKLKMRTDNFSFKEQAKGGHDTAYFVTQNKQQHRDLGNPNAIRSFIPDGQRAFNRNSRVKFGFETQAASYRPMNQRQSLELRPAANDMRHSSPAKTPGSIPKPVLNQQQVVNVHLGNQSREPPIKTSNQSFFKWIQPTLGNK